MVFKKQILYLTGTLTVLSLLVIPQTVSAETSDTPVSSSANERREKIEQRKQEIQKRVEDMREQRVAKLENSRLDACEKREQRVNAIVARSVTQSKKHLAVFQKIEERVKDFYSEKELVADNYETLVNTVDEKEAAAIAAIDVASETSFECETTDAAAPGSIVKNLVQSQHAALKEYRTAIKDLIVGVKTSVGNPDSETDTTTENETEGEQ